MKAVQFLTRLFAFREKLLTNLVEWTKPWYNRIFQKNKIPWKMNLEKLKQFPKNTLGRDLADFLEKEGFELMPKHESHDVCHVLLKYKTTVVEEARLQFFLMGNRKYTPYIIGTNVMAVIFYPEHIRSFIREFRKGKKAVSIAKWNFEHLLHEPTKRLQNIIFRRPNHETPELII